MNNPLAFDCNNISSITPEYDYSQTGAGRFRVEVDLKGDASFTIRFGAFMNHRLEVDSADNNGALLSFLMNNYADKTISHAVHDLYDIGFPVNEWVVDYIKHITSKSEKYASMLRLLTTLRNFGDEDSQDLLF